MAVESSILEQAKANLYNQEVVREQQAQAGMICAQSRLVCEELLDRYGTINRFRRERIIDILIAATVIGLPLVALCEVVSRSNRACHTWESSDTISWATRINATGEEVGVEMISHGIVLPKAPSIDVKVQGLNEYLVLSRDWAYLYKTNDYGSTMTTRVSLEDAQKWHQFITELKDHST